MNRREVIRNTCGVTGLGLFSGFQPLISLFEKSAVYKPQPFRISYGNDRIDDLYRRIDSMNWPDIKFENDWWIGTNNTILRDLVHYWRHDYDWFSIQERLNQLRHYRVPIESEQMHFVHYPVSGERQKLPLLLLHGWPQSFNDFTYAAEILSKQSPDRLGFELIIPSLPGFVFSDGPSTAGVHPARMAIRLHTLMQTLGHERYGVAGMDWGSVIGEEMARRYPDAIAGFHTLGAPWQAPVDRAPTEEEKEYIDYKQNFDMGQLGYMHIQGSRPQTLAFSLQDSPVGFLAWILEKFWFWSDHGEDLWETFDRNDVLTTAMLYWLSGRVLSSSAIYYEHFNAPQEEKTSGPVLIPTGYAKFPKEPWAPPLSIVNQDVFPQIVHYNVLPVGGHFAPLEQPELYSNDVAAFFGNL